MAKPLFWEKEKKKKKKKKEENISSLLSAEFA